MTRLRFLGSLIGAALLFCSWAQAQSPGQAVGLQSHHRSGQTFLTFQEVEVEKAGSVQYRIYRSADPIASLDGLQPLAAVSQDSAFNPRASNPRVEGRRVQIRIGEGNPVPRGRGLFVYTVPENGAYYYAVSAVVDGQENAQLSPSNSLQQPVQETIDWPQPIFQGMFRASDGQTAAHYLHFVNANPTPLLPSMAHSHDTRHIHFNFLLRNVDPQAQRPQPLILGFHGGNGIFTQALQPSGNPDEILVGFDDPHPPWGFPPAVNTLWFGFASNLGNGSPASAGEIQPYTLRRIRYLVKWVERTFRVDRNRVYCAGTSFGAIGSLMYGLHYPDEVAALWLNLPRWDFRAVGEEELIEDPASDAKIPAWDVERGGGSPVSRRFEPLFGSAELNLPTPDGALPHFRTLADGLGIYDRVNFRRLLELHPGSDLPALLIYHGKFDNVTGWHGKPGVVEALEEARQAFQFYFISSGHRFAAPTPFFERAQRRSRLHDYALNQPLVAFSRASNNGDLGDGLDMVRCARAGTGAAVDLGQTAGFVGRCIENPQGLLSGDKQGTVNGYLAWNPSDLTDLDDRFEVSLLVSPLAPQAEASADVTLRRLQNLRHAAGQRYRVENLDLATGKPLQGARIVAADELGRVTVPQVRMKKGGSRLKLLTVP